MRKYFLLFITLILCIIIAYLDCDMAGVSGLPDFYRINIRNASTVSGVIVKFKGIQWYTIAAAPDSLTPVDTITEVFADGTTLDWKVEKEIDSTVVDSGGFVLYHTLWLLIEGDNGTWNCTWSDNPWE